jgi:hypothetical protein
MWHVTALWRILSMLVSPAEAGVEGGITALPQAERMKTKLTTRAGMIKTRLSLLTIFASPCLNDYP